MMDTIVQRIIANVESFDYPIAAAPISNVYISWWDRNITVNEPVMKVIHDNGKISGQMIMFSSNI